MRGRADLKKSSKRRNKKNSEKDLEERRENIKRLYKDALDQKRKREETPAIDLRIDILKKKFNR